MTRMLVHIFVILLAASSIYGIQEHTFVHKSSLNNKQCASSVRSFTTTAVSKADCGQKCNKHDGCVSFFYTTSSERCVGCTALLSDSCGVQSSSGSLYYHRYAAPVQGEDCLSIKQNNPSSASGVYNVQLTSNRVIAVYCDMDTEGGGWTVFQYRHNGAVDFYKTFQEYTDGFGNANDEFWLGLQNIHEMAHPDVQSEIYLYLFDGYSSTKVDRAYTFSVGPSPCFKVTMENGDSDLTYNNGAYFSTMDYGPRTSCSNQRQSGWWHHYCTWINPNGRYVTPGTSVTSPSGWAGVVHVPWKIFHSMATTKIMFRRN